MMNLFIMNYLMKNDKLFTILPIYFWHSVCLFDYFW